MEENKDTKICPFCGEEIKVIAKKCKYCGEFLDNEESQAEKVKICPFCCEEIPENSEICPECGEKLDKDDKETNDCSDKIMSCKVSHPVSLIIKISAVLVILIVISILVFNKVTATPTCDSKFAEDEVLSIFNQNNSRVKEFNKRGELAYLSLEGQQATNYNKDIKRYECRATVVFHPNTVFYEGSPYGEVSDISCNVTYSIVRSKGEPLVYSTYCASRYDYN